MAGKLVGATLRVDELARDIGLRLENEELGRCDCAALPAGLRKPDTRDARVEFRQQHRGAVDGVFAAQDRLAQLDAGTSPIVESGNAEMLELFSGELERVDAVALDRRKIAEAAFPSFRYRTERGIDARPDFLVAGEAEVDEPLAVEGAGHLLQDADAPLTVLHQLVVGRQDARDPALDGGRPRNSNLHLRDARRRRVANLRAARRAANLLPDRRVIEQVVDEVLVGRAFIPQLHEAESLVVKIEPAVWNDRAAAEQSLGLLGHRDEHVAFVHNVVGRDRAGIPLFLFALHLEPARVEEIAGS